MARPDLGSDQPGEAGSRRLGIQMPPASAHRSSERAMKAYWRCFMLACLSAISAVSGAQAQTYPSKPVQILADSSAGSTPDVALRFVADRLGQIWGQQILVVNRPGAGGSVAARAAADATPDGYTLYQPVLSTFVVVAPGGAERSAACAEGLFADRLRHRKIRCSSRSRRRSASTSLPELIALAKKTPRRNHLCHDRGGAVDPSDR